MSHIKETAVVTYTGDLGLQREPALPGQHDLQPRTAATRLDINMSANFSNPPRAEWSLGALFVCRFDSDELR